ncbi:MAG: guanylate kinase [Myxococcota bacterium]|jgi:guanylate kinase
MSSSSPPLQPLLIDAPDRGVLFVVSGPSGVGKSTLITRAVKRVPGLSFSVSATTRAPRPGEVDGRDYQFMDIARFEALLADGALLEHARVYDNYYGTLRSQVETTLAGGKSILLDIDVQGARQVREGFPTAVHVFVVPPDLPTLERRLRRRNADPEQTIRRRMELAQEQLVDAALYDYIVVNGHLPTAQAVFEGVLLAALHQRSRRESALERVVRT